MPDVFTKKSAADKPNLEMRLKQKSGVTATITSATITLSAWDRLTRVLVLTDKPCTILSGTPPVDEDDPNIDFDFSTSGHNITTPGVYEYEVKVVYTGGGGTEYFPDSGYNIIEVDAEVT